MSHAYIKKQGEVLPHFERGDLVFCGTVFESFNHVGCDTVQSDG